MSCVADCYCCVAGGERRVENSDSHGGPWSLKQVLGTPIYFKGEFIFLWICVLRQNVCMHQPISPCDLKRKEQILLT